VNLKNVSIHSVVSLLQVMRVAGINASVPVREEESTVVNVREINIILTDVLAVNNNFVGITIWIFNDATIGTCLFKITDLNLFSLINHVFNENLVIVMLKSAVGGWVCGRTRACGRQLLVSCQ